MYPLFLPGNKVACLRTILNYCKKKKKKKKKMGGPFDHKYFSIKQIIIKD